MQATTNGADILIIGGGTSGAALAGLLARDSRRTVILLEAGPDYGALAGGQWPADLLDARRIPESHQWGYAGQVHSTQAGSANFSRARVLGGCSAHNGCVALLGHRHDYDTWAARGNTGWGWDAVAPAFARAITALRVRQPTDGELTPFHAAFTRGAMAAGIPPSANLNDPDENAGVSASPVNIADGVRWNSALAYLDPVRAQGNLTIVPDALVDRVQIRGRRAVAVEAIIAGERRRFTAGTIVLAAGAYGTPAILLRSGIGPTEDLRRAGIAAVHHLPGVGHGLTDHPAVEMRYRPSLRLHDASHAFATDHWCPDEQALAKARSSLGNEAFDLHLYSMISHQSETEVYTFTVIVNCMDAHSAGTLQLASADPTAAPRIDHGYLNDTEGHDIAVLREGIVLAREIMAEIPWAWAEELPPGDTAITRADLDDYIRRTVGIYYHPACSCHMGPETDALAVVGQTGAVHGLDGLFVCDASIFPTLPRANTNLPAAMIAEQLAPHIGDAV